MKGEWLWSQYIELVRLAKNAVGLFDTRSEIDALNENIEKVVDFNNQDSTTKKKLLKEAKEELQKKEPNQELTQDKILNYAIHSFIEVIILIFE